MCHFPSKLTSCLVDAAISRAVNVFTSNAVLFLLTSSKFLSCYIAGFYQYSGEKSVVSVLTPKLLRYPLFVNKNLNLQSTKLGLMYLFADFVKFSKALNLGVTGQPRQFRDFGDLVWSIDFDLSGR